PSPAPPHLATTPTSTAQQQQRTATPVRNTDGNNVDVPPPLLPAKAALHGAPARRYLNEKVTGVLLEGMKRLAVEQYVAIYYICTRGISRQLTSQLTCRPDDPLRVLGEFLLQRSREIEGTG
ncbi:MAG: hypothetical protein LQ349_001660, partial [Xanthoria aureola]